MKTIPKASVVDASRPDVRTVYRVELMRGAQVIKAYRVTTYPNSAHIFIETAETRRAIAAGPASKLVPMLKEAIAVAQQQRQVEEVGAIEREARALYEADRDPGLALRGWDDTDPDIRKRFIEQAQDQRRKGA